MLKKTEVVGKTVAQWLALLPKPKQTKKTTEEQDEPEPGDE